MTTKLILINTDTHVVVPREATESMVTIADLVWPDNRFVRETYRAMVDAAPPLTTPPVLRWEGDSLMFFKCRLIKTRERHGAWEWEWGLACNGPYKTETEAHRAAEKALGIPFEVEEV